MRIIRGIAALLITAAIIVGVPILLMIYAGNLLPHLLQLPGQLTHPDYGGAVLFGTVLPTLAWIGWAWLSIGLIIEIIAAARKVQMPRIGVFSPAQGFGSILIGAILTMGAGAAIATPASAASTESHQNTVQTAPAHPTQSARISENHAESTQAKTITVHPGDTLWSLAETHLGDGAKFKQIADLNYGHKQADGTSLTHAHDLRPGWVLQLPTHATHTEQTHTVKPGESLSSIAADHLGNADAYPQILALNPHITDPNIIQPGERLRMPTHRVAAGAASGSRSAGGHERVQKSVRGHGGGAVQRGERRSSAADESRAAAPRVVEKPGSGEESRAAEASVPAGASPAVETAVSGAGVDEDSHVVRTIGGIGGLLAAGLLGLVGARRWHRRRHRRAGERTPAVPEVARVIEHRLREVSDPVGVEQIDQVLRYLAAWAQEYEQVLPELFCVRADEGAPECALYLAESADLPVPFVRVTDDATVWKVAPGELGELGSHPSAPYPALVTIGHDENEGLVLLDLEYLGALGVQGDPDQCAQVMNALAVELAVSAWGDALQISMVGFLEALPAALGTGRVHYYQDVQGLITRLQGRARAMRDELESVGAADVRQARVQGTSAESWPPEIVLVRGVSEEELAPLYELATQLPRVGIAAVTEGFSGSEWELKLDQTSAGVLAPIGMHVSPQTLTDEEAASVVELLAFGAQKPQQDPEVEAPEEVVVGSALSLVEEPVQAEEDVSAVQQHDTADFGEIEDEEITGREEEPAGTASEPVPGLAPAGEEVEETGAAVAAAPSPEDTIEVDLEQEATSAPVIRVLGSVDVIGATGSEPLSRHTGEVSASTLARCQALLAYLVLHPDSSPEQVYQAFWPNADPHGKTAASNRNKLTATTRAYIGADEAGTAYLPHAASGYRLDPRLRSDWDVFQELIGANPTRTPTNRLIAALRLVRAAPFDGINPKSYCWNEQDKDAMINAICDAAQVLMHRAVADKDTAAANLASRVGRIVDPSNEQMWRNEMIAEHLAGSPAGVESVYQRLVDYLDGFGEDYEPEPETEQLHQELSRAHRIAS